MATIIRLVVTTSLLLGDKETDGTFDEIPVISRFEIRDASINVGLFYITGHGILQSAISGVLTAAHNFFALSLDIHKSNFTGYTALLGENTDLENLRDLHEGFDLGWEDPGSGNVRSDGSMAGENVWPDNTNNKASGNHALAVLIQYYPPQTGIVDDCTIDISSHIEYCFTILWQQNALQVLNIYPTSGSVVSIPGSLRITYDVFWSTALPSCVSGLSCKYEVVTAGEYVNSTDGYP
ncbi:hypothetical protein BJV77DRAFT_1061677 [Russula vinacea]|nr:hypothetical protein BJV77DRAFT_1061677 [Russula vinacea]